MQSLGKGSSRRFGKGRHGMGSSAIHDVIQTNTATCTCVYTKFGYDNFNKGQCKEQVFLSQMYYFTIYMASPRLGLVVEDKLSELSFSVFSTSKKRTPPKIAGPKVYVLYIEVPLYMYM